MYGSERTLEAVYRGLNIQKHGDIEPVIDMLTDLMHYCDRYSIPFDEALEMGRKHHEAEK